MSYLKITQGSVKAAQMAHNHLDTIRVRALLLKTSDRSLSFFGENVAPLKDKR